MGSPQKRNQTTFRKGHKRSPESIQKQRETLRTKYASGELQAPRTPWTEERRENHRLTKRRRALGHTRLQRIRNKVYRQVMTMNGYRYEHRVVMEAELGRALLTSEHVHHINHDTLDNRRLNLRLCTVAENQQNRISPRSDSRCSSRGVSQDARTGKFRARVQVNGKRSWLGEYDSESEAAAVVARFWAEAAA